jgi:drug/metabolite transporter (DMT)-like permease
MFVGEFACFGLLFVKQWYYRKENAKKQADADAVMLSPGGAQATALHLRTNINPLWLMIPATCDFMASTLMFIALTMVDASIYQMMRGIVVVFCALLSVIFLGRKLYRHHWTAIVLIVGGVAEVGVIAILFPDDPDSASVNDNITLGILLLLLSQVFAATMFIVEEKLLGKYYLEPFLIVGTEGMWGTAYYFVLLPIMQYIHCEHSENSLCNFGYFENSAYAFAQMGDNPWIPTLSCMTIFSIAFFNSFGIAVTKYASAAQRSTIDTSRTFLIWFFSCILGLEKFRW